MSRAFVKEADGGGGDELPEKPIGQRPNYVTAKGLEQLHAELDAAEAEQRALLAAGDAPAVKAPLARLARDIRYLRRRIDSAVVAEAAEQGADEVALGATVTIDDGTHRATYAIVGEDEADPHRGSISWSSPLARALIGAKRGERRTWQRPAGDVEVTVVDIRR